MDCKFVDLLHLPPLLHPLFLGNFSLKDHPPPLLKHVSEWQRPNNGQGLLEEEVYLCF